jgi:hypothetical protein
MYPERKYPKNGVLPCLRTRIDRGNPNAKFPSQRIDHVIVRKDGKVIGRDGRPINGSIRANPNDAHIPLIEWANWETWWMK